MDSPRFPLYLSLIGLSFLLILAADTWLIPPLSIREIYDRGYTVQGSASLRGSRSPASNYILALSGDKFHIPLALRDSYNLGENDTFYVDKSRLLRQPLTIYYPSDRPGIKGYLPMHMGILNGRFFGRFIAILTLAGFLSQLVPFIPASRKETIGYITFTMGMCMVVWYFYN